MTYIFSTGADISPKKLSRLARRSSRYTNIMTRLRKLYGGTDIRRALSIEELRAIGRRRTPNFVWEYVEGGSDEEATLKWNRAALEAIHLVPNTLVDTSGRN